MANNKGSQFVLYDFLKLLPVLALAFYIASIPHQGYPYPVHIDEWMHLTHSKAIMQAGSIAYVEPFLGRWTIDTGGNLEAGFHHL